MEGNSVACTNLNPFEVETKPQPPPNDMFKKLPDTSLVVICTRPPEKSPGKLAAADLATMILSIRLEGIMSKENARLSGSVEGKIVLFSIAELYLSAKPLTNTNLSFCIVTPFTLLRASPTVLSGVFFINSTDIPSDTTELFLTRLITAKLLSFFATDLTVISLSFWLNNVS